MTLYVTVWTVYFINWTNLSHYHEKYVFFYHHYEFLCQENVFLSYNFDFLFHNHNFYPINRPKTFYFIILTH